MTAFTEQKMLELEKDDFKIDDEESIAEYYDIKKRIDILKEDVRTVVNHPHYVLPFLQPGRLVRVKHGDMDFGWTCVVNYQPRRGPKGANLPEGTLPQDSYIVDVLAHCDIGTALAKAKGNRPFSEVTGIRPCPPDVKGEFVVIPALLSTLDGISQIRLHLQPDLKPLAAREQAFKNVKEVQRRFPDGLALLDPVENMNIKDEAFIHLIKKIETLEAALKANALTNSPKLSELYAQYSQKQSIVDNIRAIKRKIHAAESVMHLDELKKRKRVLRRLEFTTADDVVEMKGRVACEISTGDEVRGE
jgi:ATP-dependent RNA helicase DOB1